MNLSHFKFVAPLAATILLAGCGAPAVPPPPPGMAPINTAMPAAIGNPLNPLASMMPNSDVGDALKGLGALSQLGNAVDAQGNIKDPNAMSNFANSLDQMQKDIATREYNQKEAVDFPSDAPHADVLQAFAYKNGKLVNATYESMDPVDLRLSYDTLDPIKSIADFYKGLIKSPAAGWKVVSQSMGAEDGHVELSNKTTASTHDEHISVRWEMNNGIAEIHIRSWVYSQ